jgi:hypothetical protein
MPEPLPPGNELGNAPELENAATIRRLKLKLKRRDQELARLQEEVARERQRDRNLDETSIIKNSRIFLISSKADSLS